MPAMHGRTTVALKMWPFKERGRANVELQVIRCGGAADNQCTQSRGRKIFCLLRATAVVSLFAVMYG